MHNLPADSDVPKISDVPRAYCENHCAGWIERKGKRGENLGFCGKTITDPDRLCQLTWGRIRERVR